MSKILNEFKDFAMRGNVLDMAVGVIIGAAFGKIVSSLVDNILMPLIGTVTGGIDFSKLAVTVGDANIGYGLFIQNIIDFIIVAFCIFILIKGINSFKKKEEEDSKKNTLMWVFALVGAVVCVAGIAYLVYKFINNNQDEYDDFDDDFEDDFFDEEEAE